MKSAAALAPVADELRAWAVCRDLRPFGMLAAELDDLFGGGWCHVAITSASEWMSDRQDAGPELLLLAVDAQDEASFDALAEIVRDAAAQNLPVLVVAKDVSPAGLHRLLSFGAAAFVPYPMPGGALQDAIDKVRSRPQQPPRTTVGARRDGWVLPVHGLGGGLGATTFAVNLAWELTTVTKVDPPRVCLLDLDLQFGSTSTFLDLPRREAVVELLSNPEVMDPDGFLQALVPFQSQLRVLTAPPEMLPLDFIGQREVACLLDQARARFDYVIIDMPKTVTMWTETVLGAAHFYFAVLERDMRSAQNALRMIRALKADDLAADKLRFVLNRAPGLTDLAGKSRVRRLAETLEVALELQLPDGGRQVTNCADYGAPLALQAARNPLRKEIRRFAGSLHKINESVTQSG